MLLFAPVASWSLNSVERTKVDPSRLRSFSGQNVLVPVRIDLCDSSLLRCLLFLQVEKLMEMVEDIVSLAKWDHSYGWDWIGMRSLTCYCCYC